MRTVKILAAIALSPAIAVSAWAQGSTPPATPNEQTSTGTEVAQPPLSGVQLQGNGDQAKPSGFMVPVLMFSGTETWNGNVTDWQSAISGYLDYTQTSQRGAFNLRYGGGLFGGADFLRTNIFQNLSVSESFALRRWKFILGDILSYLPQAPVGAGIGIPGLGQNLPNPIGNLNPNLLPSQSILTFNNTSINDSGYGQAQYNFTRRTSFTAIGSYGLLLYPDDNVLDGHQMVFSTGLNHDFGRSQIAVQYSYSRFAYDSFDATTETHTAQLMYSRSLTANFTAQIAVGPEIVHSLGTSSVVESGLAAMVYGKGRNHGTLRYIRGINGGSGLLQGANSNTIQLSADRQYRLWRISFNVSYVSNSGITQNGKSIARSSGAQLTRSFGQTISGYLNYTYLSQDSGALCVGNVCGFNGDEHVIGVGFSWQPRGLRIGK